MKQTVEEAAIESCVIDRSIYNDEYQPYYLDGFKDGAEWQAKQSPWISVEERLPEPDKEVLLYDKNSIRHYVIGWLRIHKGYNKGMWVLINGWVEDKNITHWMPIPSFDEILEANRDVLERIKEKGD